MTTPTLAQRWILACGAVLTHVNEGDLTVLGGWRRPEGSEHGTGCLRAGWRARTPEELLATLQHLQSSGHRAELAPKAGLPPAAMLAWDLGRLVNVAGWGYLAYLLDEQTAWGWMTAAATQIQRELPGWQAFAESYDRGRAAWAESLGGGIDMVETRNALGALLAGAWRELPWSTPLQGTPVPLDPPRVRRVARAPGAHPTIAAALEAAADGDRIVVAPGDYDEALVFGRSVEIVAEAPGVTLRAHGGPCVHVDEAGVCLVGMALRGAGTDEDGDPASAVWSGGGFLRMVRCDVQGEGVGVLLLNDASEVQLEDCTLHDGLGGVTAQGGFLSAVRCEVRSSEEAGVYVGEGTDAFLVQCRVHEGKSAGLFVTEGARAEVRACELARHAEANVVVADKAGARLLDCRVIGGQGVGIQVRDKASVFLQGCEAREHGGNGLEVADSQIAMLECKVVASGGTSLYVSGGGSVKLESCELRGATSSCLVVEGSEAVVHLSTLAGSKEGSAAWVHGGSRARFARCTLDETALASLEVRDQGTAVQLVECTLRESATQSVLAHHGADVQAAKCTFAAGGECGVLVETGATARFEESLVEGSKGSGAVVRGGGRAHLVRSGVRGNALWGFEIGDGGVGGATGCLVEGNTEGGIFVVAGGSLVAENTEVARQGDEGIRIASQQAELRGCRVHDNTGCGLVIGEDARARFEGCEISGNGNGGLQAWDRGDALLVRCRVAGNPEDDVYAYDGGRCTLEECDVGGGGARAVVAESGGAVVLRRTRLTPGRTGAIVEDGGRVVQE